MLKRNSLIVLILLFFLSFGTVYNSYGQTGFWGGLNRNQLSSDAAGKGADLIGVYNWVSTKLGAFFRGKYVVEQSTTDQGAAGSAGTLAYLVNIIGSDRATIEITGEYEYTLSTALTIPNTIDLEIRNGATIKPASGINLTCSADSIKAQPDQFIFDLTAGGSVVYNAGDTVYPAHAGLTPVELTASEPAAGVISNNDLSIAWALSVGSTINGKIIFPKGAIWYSDVSNNEITDTVLMYGAGKRQTVFRPAASHVGGWFLTVNDCWRYAGVGEGHQTIDFSNTYSGVTLRDFSIVGDRSSDPSGTNGIRTYKRVDQITVENVDILYLNGGGLFLGYYGGDSVNGLVRESVIRSVFVRGCGNDDYYPWVVDSKSIEAAVTGVSLTNPCVVTFSAGHEYSNGDSIQFANVGGTTELNGNSYTVANVTGTTLELSGINATGYTTYTSGGRSYLEGTDATNNIRFYDFHSVYNFKNGFVAGSSPARHTRRIDFFGMQLHGLNTDASAPAYDILKIHGNIDAVRFHGLEANGSPEVAGTPYYLIRIEDNSAGDKPSGVFIDLDMRTCEGGGIAIDDIGYGSIISGYSETASIGTGAAGTAQELIVASGAMSGEQTLQYSVQAQDTNREITIDSSVINAVNFAWTDTNSLPIRVESGQLKFGDGGSISATNIPSIYFGTDSTPEGAITAGRRSIYLKYNSDYNDLAVEGIWVKASGTSNTGWARILYFIDTTTAALESAAATINTTSKWEGMPVWNRTTQEMVYASGTGASDPWVYSDGTTAYTPI